MVNTAVTGTNLQPPTQGERPSRRDFVAKVVGALVGGVAVVLPGSVEAAPPWWFAGLDWANWRNWIHRWLDIAAQYIRRVRVNWKRIALNTAVGMALRGASEWAITSYLRRQGMYCPNRPVWLWMGPFAPAWPIITCAHFAE